MISKIDLLKLSELSGLLPIVNDKMVNEIFKMIKMIDKIIDFNLPTDYPRWEGLRGKKLLKKDIVCPQKVVLLNQDSYGYVKGINENYEQD